MHCSRISASGWKPTVSWRRKTTRTRRVNFVYTPHPKRNSLVARLEAYDNRTDTIWLHPTTSPEPPDGVDCYVIEARRLAELTNPAHAPPVHLPVIAYGTAGELRISYLEGCSDFMKEPWTPEELHFRVLRQPTSKCFGFRWGELEVTGSGVTVRTLGTAGADAHSMLLRFPEPELRIFEVLLAERGTVVSRNALFYAIGDRPGEGSRSIDMHISRLRRALAYAMGDDRFRTIIRTVYGRGYIVDN